VKDNSTVGRPSSGLKKPNHCSNGVPVIPKNDSMEIIPNGHVKGHHSDVTEDEPPAVNGHKEDGGRETVNSRGRSRERQSPRVHRGEDSHLHFMILIFINGYVKWFPVTMEWHGMSLGCRWRRWPPEMEGSCECVQKAVVDS
jgi:hypothetical protein